MLTHLQFHFRIIIITDNKQTTRNKKTLMSIYCGRPFTSSYSGSDRLYNLIQFQRLLFRPFYFLFWPGGWLLLCVLPFSFVIVVVWYVSPLNVTSLFSRLFVFSFFFVLQSFLLSFFLLFNFFSGSLYLPLSCKRVSASNETL